jgi:hypothetical protein
MKIALEVAALLVCIVCFSKGLRAIIELRKQNLDSREESHAKRMDRGRGKAA